MVSEVCLSLVTESMLPLCYNHLVGEGMFAPFLNVFQILDVSDAVYTSNTLSVL